MSEEKNGNVQRLSDWFHIPAQIIVACFCVYWYQHPPAPNKAVLILTAVTILMALLEMRPRHKAVYLLLVICLMSIENRAINKDRADSLRAEQDRTKEEREKFQAIAEDLQKTMQQNAQQFDKTMRRSDAIMAGVSDSTKTQTGGDSFAYITLTPEPANVRFVPFPAPAVPWFLVSITSHGKYPLRDVKAILMDDDRRKGAVVEYNKHPDGDWIRAIQSADTVYQVPYLRPQSPEGPSGDVQLLGPYPIPESDSNKISIAFSSPNGYWNETLHLGRVNGVWHQCLSIMGPSLKQTKNPFLQCDSEWVEGKALAEKDWPRINRGSRKE